MNQELKVDEDREILMKCARSLGLSFIADSIAANKKLETLSGYVSIIKKKAILEKRTDVLETLFFGGLIYG
jgi:hypothetical protein